ncbi:MAG: hypothetical protein GYB67_19405 [Chloroflexi bacterium]|nr:hypothetical protein [Chloroflexota bacterium]
MIRKLMFLTAALIGLISGITLAQPGNSAYRPYGWVAADLALLIPAGWTVSEADDSAALPTLTLSLMSGDQTAALIRFAVLPDTTSDADLNAARLTALADLEMVALSLTPTTWFGRAALAADAVSVDRTQTGSVRIGRLPDRRVLTIAGRGSPTLVPDFAQIFADVRDSIAFSAASPPTAPSYGLVWRLPFVEPLAEAGGLVAAPGILTAVSADQGVVQYNPQTGALISAAPFPAEAQPTAAALTGTRYHIGDALCGCVQRLQGSVWGAPTGTFGSGAPFDLAARANGVVYAVDSALNGYRLQILGDGPDRIVPFSAAASAPPLLTVTPADDVLILEPLPAIHSEVGAGLRAIISRLENDALAPQFALDVAAERIRDFAAGPDGRVALALGAGGWLILDAAGRIITSEPDPAAHAVAFGTNGDLYLARGDGALTAIERRDPSLPPDRAGAPELLPDVPVQGVLNETIIAQEWTYSGTAGEEITVAAVDLGRADEFAVGIDMDLRVSGPDGVEIAYNDDQPGPDLFGVFDAQIPDLTLPVTGIYTITVGWRQGAGTYTLGINGNRDIELTGQGVAEVSGQLQDVFPVQRWLLTAEAGATYTITMIAESGDLDPAIELLNPDGSTLAYNDDASDRELGFDAQLVRVTLPEGGTYVIEASRFAGSGRYRLIVVAA